MREKQNEKQNEKQLSRLFPIVLLFEVLLNIISTCITHCVRTCVSLMPLNVSDPPALQSPKSVIRAAIYPARREKGIHTEH